MKIDNDKFLFLYQQEAFETLNDHQRGGLIDLLGFISADDAIEYPQWAAYMLATTKHETANTFLPIAEYGKGAGHPYGVPDHVTGQVYYGRGYVQLTWRDNYAVFTKITGADLLSNPDLAMKPDIAYKIMSYGMTRGTFTGVGLRKYINNEQCDYVNARKIINGLDCAEKIAGYAQKFASILAQCS
jgi:Chitinase class I